MFMTCGCAREQGLAPLDVIGETTGGEHHCLARMDADLALGGIDHRAPDVIALLQ
ncbi:hypothetical protein D3C87_1304790 [compost metagenome]